MNILWVQIPSVHILVSLFPPSQSLPGMRDPTQSLTRDCVPVPHVEEQVVQSDHKVQVPLSGQGTMAEGLELTIYTEDTDEISS